MNILYNKFKYLLLCLLIFSVLPIKLFAGTTGKIAGKVIDAKTKEPLIGANIIIVGSSQGAATDVNGNYFIINLSPNSETFDS